MQQARQWRLAVAAFWVLTALAVTTYVVINNAASIGLLTSLSIGQYIGAMVGLLVICLATAGSAFGTAHWLYTHRELRPR